MDGSIATLLLPFGFGALVLVPLSIPLRMIWLAAIFHPDRTLRKQAHLGLQRTPSALGASLLVGALGSLLLGLLALGAWLVHSSFEGDPNPQNAALWTSLALLPFALGSLFFFAAIDLVSAACLHNPPFDSFRHVGAMTLRALPAYALYSMVCVASIVAGVYLDATPWILLPTLQTLVFGRYLARSFWLRQALRRMTTPARHAMQAK